MAPVLGLDHSLPPETCFDGIPDAGSGFMSGAKITCRTNDHQ
jgi:hypothetical protein